MKQLILCACILSAGFFPMKESAAQVQLPQFSISNIPTIELENNIQLDNEAAFARIANPVMRDTLRLQYQINLIEKLIRRQTEIQRIANSYKSIGLPFNQPAPPRTACEQLPFNMLCMAFYPESTKYKNLIDERREEFDREQARRMEQMMVNINMSDFDRNAGPTVPSGSNFTAEQRVTKDNPNNLYKWSDIRCLAGDCSALLVSNENSQTRFRIRDGEELPTGGEIQKISSSGVTANFENEQYELTALEVSVSNTPPAVQADNQIADILNENLGEDANVSEAVQEENAADAAITPQTVGGVGGVPDVLGVTGLF